MASVEVLTSPELAKMMRVHHFTVNRLAREGRIPGAFRFGGSWRFATQSLRTWIAKGGESSPWRKSKRVK